MIPKPRKFNQDWLKMEKIDGGRICGKCEQKMVDFTKMSWNEIEQVHAENPGQCGMYSQKQLNHWGYEPPSIFSECSKIAIVFSSLFAGIGFQSAEAKPLNIQKEAIHFSPVEMKTDSIPENLKVDKSAEKMITLKGKIIDNKTKKPISVGVSSLMSPHNYTNSNSEGVFEIQVLKNIHFKHNVVQIGMPGYHIREVSVSLLEDNFLVIPLEPYSEEDNKKLNEIINNPIYYGVSQPSLYRRLKGTSIPF